MSCEMESLWVAMKDTHYKRTISKVARSIRDIKNVEDIMPATLGMVVEVIHAETGTLWFYERFKDGCIYPKAVYSGANLDGLKLLPGEGIAGKVIETGKSVIIENCQMDSRWAGRIDEKTGFCTKTMICVPLMVDDVVFGSIQIINKTDEMSFDKKDLAMAEQLANEIVALFKQRGLLDGYIMDHRSCEIQKQNVSFQDVFCAKSEREMINKLKDLDEFDMLKTGQQQDFLNLARQMRKYFVK